MRGRCRRPGRTWGGSRLLAHAVCVLALASPLIVPRAAGALALDVPSVAKLTLDVGVRPEPTDPGGLGLLYCDGVLVRSMTLRASTPATFTAVAITPGTHSLRVLLRWRAGIITSAPKTVTAWSPPSAPVPGGSMPALCPRPVTFPVSVAGGASSLTLLVDNRYAWSKAIKPPVTVPVTLLLPSGVHKVELRAGNPVETRTTVLQLTRATWPVPGYARVTSRFGPRLHPILGTYRFHAGLDIGAPSGVRVATAGPGTVTFAGSRGGCGNTVIVDHGGSTATQYSHLSSIDVRCGQQLMLGQRVGAVGSTGLSTGPHLHFEVRVNGNPRDPMGFL